MKAFRYLSFVAKINVRRQFSEHRSGLRRWMTSSKQRIGLSRHRSVLITLLSRPMTNTFISFDIYSFWLIMLATFKFHYLFAKMNLHDIPQRQSSDKRTPDFINKRCAISRNGVGDTFRAFVTFKGEIMISMKSSRHKHQLSLPPALAQGRSRTQQG